MLHSFYYTLWQFTLDLIVVSQSFALHGADHNGVDGLQNPPDCLVQLPRQGSRHSTKVPKKNTEPTAAGVVMSNIRPTVEPFLTSCNVTDPTTTLQLNKLLYCSM